MIQSSSKGCDAIRKRSYIFLCLAETTFVTAPDDVTQCLHCIMGNVAVPPPVTLLDSLWTQMIKIDTAESDTGILSLCLMIEPHAYITHNATQPLSESPVIV